MTRIALPCDPSESRALPCWRGALSLVCALGLAGALGCSETQSKQKKQDQTWESHDRLQVQFFAPPGAVVKIRHIEDSEEVSDYEYEHRLEGSESCAVFNLRPSKRAYDFTYRAGEGDTATNVYGELQVFAPQSEEAKLLWELSQIPLALPAEHGGRQTDRFFPVEGSSGTAAANLELAALRQGGLVRKVYFVADLQRAWDSVRMIDFHIEKLRSAESVLTADIQLVDARYTAYRREALYGDPTVDPITASRDRSGKNDMYIKLEASRQQMENQRYLIRHQVDDLLEEKRIRTRLLDSMRIVNRRGSLVLATPESQWPWHDTIRQVSMSRVYEGHTVGPKEAYDTGSIELPPLGEVVLVMRVGGRHQQWAPEVPGMAMGNP